MDEVQIDVEGAVEKAQAVRDRLKSDPAAVRKILGGNYEVTSSATVYPRKDLNKRYADLRPKLDAIAADTKQREDESNEDWDARIIESQAKNQSVLDEFRELQEQIDDSAVTFELVGVSKKTIKELRKTARKQFPLPKDGSADDPDNAEDRDEFYQSSIIAAHLVRDGYTVEDILQIRDEWSSVCWATLWIKAQELSIQDDYLRGSFTPDFS